MTKAKTKPLAVMLADAGHTQEHAAEALGKSQPRVSRLLAGLDVPNAHELRTLSGLLKVDRATIVAAWATAAIRTAKKRAALLEAESK